jgi:hypothetical protein
VLITEPEPLRELITSSTFLDVKTVFGATLVSCTNNGATLASHRWFGPVFQVKAVLPGGAKRANRSLDKLISNHDLNVFTKSATLTHGLATSLGGCVDLLVILNLKTAYDKVGLTVSEL